MKIVLYGLGQGLDFVLKKIKKEHEIIGYMDSYSEITVFRERPFYKLENISQIFFDYIVITIQNRESAWQVYEMLIHTYKICEDHVIPFFLYANYEMHDIKMRQCDLEKIEGLIFGNSYAKYGFLEEELVIPFLNLAVDAQDIYYDYRIFQQCIAKYGERLKKLHYIIVDLYDYNYFNIDTSMSTGAMDYICWGGYFDEHNFKKNTRFQKAFREELFNRFRLLKGNNSVFEVFENIDLQQVEARCPSTRWAHIMKKGNSLTFGPIIGSPVLKRSEDTIKENIALMDTFLKEVQEFNANIKIIFTLIPRYIEMEQATQIIMEKLWKKEFENIISNFCDKYNVLFWNYKERQEISKNHMFYYDLEHLNTVGGRALTAILNQDLNEISAQMQG